MKFINPNIGATVHRVGVALAPLIAGCSAIVVQGLANQEFTKDDLWLLAASAFGSLLTSYWNWVRATSPQTPPGP